MTKRHLLRWAAGLLCLFGASSPMAQTAIQFGVNRTISPWQICVYDSANICQPFLNLPSAGGGAIVPPANGGLGIEAPTGYLFFNGSSSPTASTTIPSTAISGIIPGSLLPPPTPTSLGGVFSAAASENLFQTGILPNGEPTFAQPSFLNLSGSLACEQAPSLTGNVTTSAGSCATSISAGAVTNAKMAAGAAADNIGALGGVLVGSLPNPTLASGAAIANLGFTPVNKAGDTMTGLLTLPSINMSAEPSQSFLWAGVSTDISDLRQVPGSLASTPEIVNVNIINGTGGGSNPVAFFKMNYGTICTTQAGSAGCWNHNNVMDLQAGSGTVGGTQIENDMINLDHDFLSPSDNPLAVSFYATGAVTSAYYADCAFCVTGAGPTWSFGLLGSQFTHPAATVTLSLATPGVVNQTAHGYLVGQSVVFTTTGALPTGLTAGTRYYVIAAGLTANAFEVAAAPGGSAVAFTGTQSGVQTSSGANVFGTAFIADFSNAPTSYLLQGNHTIGIDLRGANYSLAAIIGDNWFVDQTGDLTAFTLTAANNYSFADHPLFVVTAPTIKSGFGASPSIVAANGTATFLINVGTGGTANSGVAGLSAATVGWNCVATDITTMSPTVFLTKQTSSTPTSVTLGNFNDSGAASPWAANDFVAVSCVGF